MKKQILAMTVLAAATAATAASAADLPRNNYYSQPAPGSYYNWGGWYAGAVVGYQWGKVPGTNTKPSGVLGGLTGGYNWQSGQFVLGGETDLQISGADDTFAPYKFSNPWFGTLRGRVGMAWNNILVYVTGGIAYGGLKGDSGALSESKTHVGWTLGTGVEFGLAQQWSAKIEYLYADLSNRTYSITGVGNGLENNLIRVGVNYRF
ncbi:MAG TPA: outer membrane protein [Pseudolabrys sp.]|nr:outer membrane protein [Pseudolabrys sp.]